MHIKKTLTRLRDVEVPQGHLCFYPNQRFGETPARKRPLQITLVTVFVKAFRCQACFNNGVRAAALNSAVMSSAK